MSSVFFGSSDPFNVRSLLEKSGHQACFWSLINLQETGIGNVFKLPYSLRHLLEATLRMQDGIQYRPEHVKTFFNGRTESIPFCPARVLLQDFTGVPVVVDLATMRDFAAALGKDPARIKPLRPGQLVIDHSVQIGVTGSGGLKANQDAELELNRERFQLLRWAQNVLPGLMVIPPGVGICHQVNLEFLTTCVRFDHESGIALLDSCFGTDSHTTMAGALGILAWGVGGIEGMAAILNQPTIMPIPKVVGVKLTGSLPPGTTATDLVLTVTQLLRKVGVVDKFVEFIGPGVSALQVPDRATIANMAPEYGATIGFFPYDARTSQYLLETGRSEPDVLAIETYLNAQGLFRTEFSPEPEYDQLIELDLGSISPCVAGPLLPEQRIPLEQVKLAVNNAISATDKSGFGVTAERRANSVALQTQRGPTELTHGSLALAAITSCTNTSNPALLVAAGILARRARARGLSVPSYVKTSFAPGSRVAVDYLGKAGLLEDLEHLGFNAVAFGCTTCIGNSGPLEASIDAAIQEADLCVGAVLSGNRNFSGRVHARTKLNLLASPPLVVAFALAGRVDINLLEEPLGIDAAGQPVLLSELWPSEEDIQAALKGAMSSEQYVARYSPSALRGSENWQALPFTPSNQFEWIPGSTYIHQAPWFAVPRLPFGSGEQIESARVLVVAGDSTTTDHISPAGDIHLDSPAGEFLVMNGAAEAHFNSYGARRGHKDVMVRGTFANKTLVNRLVPPEWLNSNKPTTGMTRHIPTGEIVPVYTAAARYQLTQTPLIILAGKDYGKGSSRDWAAKGPRLMGVQAVIAESFERIHRQNLICLGILPLVFKTGETMETLGLTGDETYSIGPFDTLGVLAEIAVAARRIDGQVKYFSVIARLLTDNDLRMVRAGGILPGVMEELLHA